MKSGLEELETRLAFQEDTIQALNDIVTKQQVQIDSLEAAVKRLSERVGSLQASQIALEAEEEKPPHY
jgi:SlyX protein